MDQFRWPEIFRLPIESSIRENLQVSYGGIKALNGIDLEVPDGKIVTLIGANGAGKSTLLRTISGLVKSSTGSIKFEDKELCGMAINKI